MGDFLKRVSSSGDVSDLQGTSQTRNNSNIQGGSVDQKMASELDKAPVVTTAENITERSMGKKLLDGLKSALNWLKENVFLPLWDVAVSAFKVALETITKALTEALEKKVGTVTENVTEALGKL
jgi:hypothetical protein